MDKELVKIRAAFADDKNLSGEAEGLAQLAPCKAALHHKPTSISTPHLATCNACTLPLLLFPAVIVATNPLPCAASFPACCQATTSASMSGSCCTST